MLKFGIIGFPLTHSLSPVMQTSALQYLNISGEYKAYEVQENEFEKKIQELKELGLLGFNVTIPYKTKIIPLIDELNPQAKLICAVNTVTIKKDGKLVGDNTDAVGFWEAIPEKTREEIKEKIPEQNIAILGCGGSANAVAIALIQNVENIKKLKLYGRDKDKLFNFKRSFNSANIEIDLLPNIDLSNTCMLINTTPLGMYPNVNDSPILKADLKKLPEGAFVYDIIYNPQETQLIKLAKSLNLKTQNGVEMLIRQGAASLAIWLKQEAPIGAMRLAVDECLEKSLQV